MGLLHSPLSPTDGLVLCLDSANRRSYPGSGNTWFDLSGNANNGTLTNGASYNGFAMNFDGINDYIRGAYTGLSYPFSISCWGMANSLHTGYLCGFFSSSSNDPVMALNFSVDGYFVIHAELAGQQLIISSISYNINQWYHIVGVFASSTQRQLFVNRSLVGSSSVGVTISPTINRFSLGCFDRPTQASFLNGSVDDVRVYNRTLSAVEIGILFNSKRMRYGL